MENLNINNYQPTNQLNYQTNPNLNTFTPTFKTYTINHNTITKLILPPHLILQNFYNLFNTLPKTLQTQIQKTYPNHFKSNPLTINQQIILYRKWVFNPLTQNHIYPYIAANDYTSLTPTTT